MPSRETATTKMSSTAGVPRAMVPRRRFANDSANATTTVTTTATAVGNEAAHPMARAAGRRRR